MRVDLILVPYHMGQERVGPGNGPERYVEGGAEWALAEGGHQSRIKTVLRAHPEETDEIAAVLDVDKQLALAVRDSMESGRFPLVLAGNCNSALGTLAGIGSAELGIVWFDAHGDYNTPATTISGWFEGMPLAIANGQCYPDVWQGIGNRRPIREANTILAGVRDLDPGERDLLERSEVQVIPAERLRASGSEMALISPLTVLQSRARAIYLHLDIDALDPADAPGVDYRSPGGMSVDQLVQAIGMIGRRFEIKAAALTSFNPMHDEEDRTVHSGLRLMRAVVDAAVRPTLG